jgi:hypothetical protein
MRCHCVYLRKINASNVFYLIVAQTISAVEQKRRTSVSAEAIFMMDSQGLPDFSWYMIPKPEKMHQRNKKMYQMFIKYPKSL